MPSYSVAVSAPFVLSAADVRARRAELVDILVNVVSLGGSVGWVSIAPGEAAAFWDEIAQHADAGRRIVFGIETEGRLDGTCQLVLALPPNQPHRAELAKMLVHSRARRRGYGAALLAAAEARAEIEGRSLVTLDTITGGDADRLYRRAGWSQAGEFPDWALHPDGSLQPTSLFYKRLAPPNPGET